MELTDAERALIEAAQETGDRLYLKDVHEVAAALRTRSGHVYTGIHIEADVGFADVCGEVAAICNMVSAGERDLESIVALYRHEDGRFTLLSPCGRCRELINDFNPHARVIVGTLEHPLVEPISKLLPYRDKAAWNGTEARLDKEE
jgi:cytidine deaminase